MSYILDTNVWVSFFDEDDSNNKKAESILKSLSKEKEQIMPDLVFYETLTVLKIKTNLQLSKDFMDSVKDNRDVTIRLFYEYNRIVANLMINPIYTHLSYVDTLLLYLSKTYTIITFDKQLIQAIDVYGGKAYRIG